jgi:hypothetical protein
MDTNCNRNATATWSGFSHQGQIGLLVALREMNRLKNEDLENEFDIHFLEYESREDVAIYKKIGDATPEYLSVHQVKAYHSNGHLINTYKSVFRGSVIYQTDDNGKKIPTGEYESGQWCDNDNYLHTVKEITNWTKEAIEEIGNDNNVKRYNYKDGVFHCDTTGVEAYILDELKSDLFCGSDLGAAKLALKRLTYSLDFKIREEHQTKNGKKEYDINFSFSKLNEIINDNQDFSEHELYISRELFYSTFNEAILCEEFNEDNLRRIEKVIIEPIYNSSDENFLSFMKQLNIHETSENLKFAQIHFNKDGLLDVFFYVLQAINVKLPLNKKSTVRYKQEGSNTEYILTAIKRKTGKKEVVKNILENLDKVDMLWENNLFVNENFEGSFQKLNPDIIGIPEKEIAQDDERKKFMGFTGKSGLIKTDTVIKKINNG